MRTIRLTEQQCHACPHGATAQPEVTSDAAGCEECLKIGDRWVHLRICMHCGAVGCCDSSKNRHATHHWQSSQHPVMHSFERGEEWGWCYPDERML